jgi:thiamine pyrophosphate-dependent acetolactate synthase large subunit-like protein
MAIESVRLPFQLLQKERRQFPATMPLGEFLFEYLYRRGVRSFGIPGDFALPTFTWLEKSKIRSITMTHEPAAGFAADAYSRIRKSQIVSM